jgi:sorbitol-specific phosphotransferase system component IIC
MTQELSYVLVGLAAWICVSIPGTYLIGRFIEEGQKTECTRKEKKMSSPKIQWGQIVSWVFTFSGLVLLTYMIFVRLQ